jgi:hypothetical protein
MAATGGCVALTPTPGATVTIAIDSSARMNLASWTAAQSETVNLSGTPLDGQELLVLITNDATSRTITFGAGLSAASTLVGVINKKSLISFYAVGGKFYESSRVVGTLT